MVVDHGVGQLVNGLLDQEKELCVGQVEVFFCEDGSVGVIHQPIEERGLTLHLHDRADRRSCDEPDHTGLKPGVFCLYAVDEAQNIVFSYIRERDGVLVRPFNTCLVVDLTVVAARYSGYGGYTSFFRVMWLFVGCDSREDGFDFRVVVIGLQLTLLLLSRRRRGGGLSCCHPDCLRRGKAGVFL